MPTKTDYTNNHIQDSIAIDTSRFACFPRFNCADGYSVSIQAGEYKYSTPELSNAPHYTHVELGFPSYYDPMIDEWCEDPGNPTKTVYPYTPIEVVNALIEKHGGPASE